MSVFSRRSHLAFLLGLVGCTVVIVGMGFFLSFTSWLEQIDWLKIQMNKMGWAAPFVFVTGVSVFSFFGAPRLVLSSIAGVLFGFWEGLIWSQLAILLGAYGTFFSVRILGQEAILRRYPSLKKYSVSIQKHGLLTVFITRQLPIHAFYNNILLGLSSIRHRDFLLGSLLGYLPLSTVAVLAGSGVVETDITQLVRYTAITTIIFLLFGVLLKYFVSRKIQGVSFSITSLSVNHPIE